MSAPVTDIVCVKGRSQDGSVTKFYRRSSGIVLDDYKFIRTVTPTDPNGFAFDEYVHKDDYASYVQAYREQGLL